MSTKNAAVTTPDYSTFNLSHLHRTSMDMGNLVPISVIPTLPGDRINVDVQAFIRGMPTIAPIIDKVDIKVNHFYVPYRVLWEKFPEMLAESDTWKVTGEAKPTIPQVVLNNTATQNKYPFGRLADYLGIPSHVDLWEDNVGVEFSLMPFLAYQKIFLEYYAPQRWVQYLTADQNGHELFQLKRSLEQVKKSVGGQYTRSENWGSGLDQNPVFKMRKVGWNHDYFTNALPTPTLFDDVKMPMFDVDETDGTYFQVSGTNLPFGGASQQGIFNQRKLATIRDLRQNIALQHYLEKMQLGGGRYMETLKVLWGQDIGDKTLQRPEYLGGDVIPLFVNEVEQTAQTAEGNLGDLGGKPIGAGRLENKTFTADEHGLYMCIAHIVPKRSYSHAVEKNIWKVKETTDLPIPEFEGIGDQAVMQYELSGRGDTVFGYVPRYSEYKGKLDRYSGELRESLLHWHLGTTQQQFENHQEISPEFIECNPRNDIFLVDEPDKFIASFQFDVKASRKLSANPVTGMNRI